MATVSFKKSYKADKENEDALVKAFKNPHVITIKKNKHNLL